MKRKQEPRLYSIQIKLIIPRALKLHFREAYSLLTHKLFRELRWKGADKKLFISLPLVERELKFEGELWAESRWVSWVSTVLLKAINISVSILFLVSVAGIKTAKLYETRSKLIFYECVFIMFIAIYTQPVECSTFVTILLGRTGFETKIIMGNMFLEF